jgi:hypothetical protein
MGQKVGEGTYGSMTIAKAIEFTTECYSPNGYHSNGYEPANTLPEHEEAWPQLGEVPELLLRAVYR